MKKALLNPYAVHAKKVQTIFLKSFSRGREIIPGGENSPSLTVPEVGRRINIAIIINLELTFNSVQIVK